MAHHPSHIRLFVFMGLVFGATILAGILMQMSGNATASALVVGSQSVSQSDHGVQVTGLSVEDVDLDGAFEAVYVTVQLKEGSSQMDLDDVLVQFASPSTMQTAVYKGEYNCDDFGAIYAGEREFNAQYVTKGPEYLTGYLSQGDVLRVCFTSAVSFDQGEIEITFIPKIGSVGVAGGTVQHQGSAVEQVV